MLYCETLYKNNNENNEFSFLIIEDSEFFNKTIFDFLSKHSHYQVDTTLNFETAKRLLNENEYDFIILDLNLPDAYGEELVLDIKRLSKAKIIVLSAEEDVQMRESLFKNGILDYLVKDKNFSFSLKAVEHIVKTVNNNKGKSVLIIDDSLFICKQLQKILEIHNYHVYIALNAQEGMRALKEYEINTIVLDMELPDKHGLDILRDMKDIDEFCQIPVIVISGHYNPEIVRISLKTGASDFIKKPFNIEELTLKVDAAIETNRKYTEIICTKKTLREYKDAIDNSTLVSKTNKHGIIIEVNEAFCKLSGYKKEELIGMPHNIVRHPDMPTNVFQEMWKTIQSKKVWRGLIKNRAKDGNTYYVKSIINPIIDASGNIVEYIAIRTDVTELENYKELLEEELKASHNNLHYLKQQEDAMAQFVSIMKTTPKGTITYTNKQFQEMSGYSENELLGRQCRFLRVSKHIEVGDCEKIEQQLLNQDTVSVTFQNVTKNHKSFFTDTTIYPIINEKKEIVEHLHLMYNITDIIQSHEKMIETQKEIIYRLGEVGESRSQETGNHVKRVAKYSRLLAYLAGLSEKDADLLHLVSPMHDIGKIGIPDAILKKPGRLTDEEFEIMKKHSTIGFDILKKSKQSILKAAALVAYLHHEKWDGSGYPNGLKGEKIHIFGRITAIADVFDALGSDRCYKKAWPLEKILKLFEEEKGKHFDPKLIELFMTNLDQFLEIRQKYKDEF